MVDSIICTSTFFGSLDQCICRNCRNPEDNQALNGTYDKLALVRKQYNAIQYSPGALIMPEHSIIHSHIDTWSLVVKCNHLATHAPKDKRVIIWWVKALARRVHAGNLWQIMCYEVIVLWEKSVNAILIDTASFTFDIKGLHCLLTHSLTYFKIYLY